MKTQQSNFRTIVFYLVLLAVGFVHACYPFYSPSIYLSLIRMHIFHQTQDYFLHISFDGKLIIIFCVEYEANVLQQEQHTHRHTLGNF